MVRVTGKWVVVLRDEQGVPVLCQSGLSEGDVIWLLSSESVPYDVALLEANKWRRMYPGFSATIHCVDRLQAPRESVRVHWPLTLALWLAQGCIALAAACLAYRLSWRT